MSRDDSTRRSKVGTYYSPFITTESKSILPGYCPASTFTFAGYNLPSSSLANPEGKSQRGILKIILSIWYRLSPSSHTVSQALPHM